MIGELRKQVLHDMKALSQEHKQAIDQVNTEHFLQPSFYLDHKVSATYLFFSHEFQTRTD